MINQTYEKIDKFSDIIIKNIKNEFIIKQNQKKKLIGGNPLYNMITTFENIIEWFRKNLFSPLFKYMDSFIKWYFIPDGSMPCRIAHLSFLAFVLALLLFIIENILIITIRIITDLFLKKMNVNSFNLNYWINFVQLYFVLIFYTFIYKFLKGNIDTIYFYVLLTILIFLFQKGLIIQVIYNITGIWINY